MVLGAYLSGQDIVRNCMQDGVIREFMNQTIYEEIIPTLTLPREELMDFAKAVTDRFNNPFIDHALLAISLNSTSKWKARVMPSFKGYVDKFGKLPECITASLAFYIAFYRGVRLDEDGFAGVRNGKNMPLRMTGRFWSFIMLIGMTMRQPSLGQFSGIEGSGERTLRYMKGLPKKLLRIWS